MLVTIRNMTEEEYKIFYQWSIAQQAKELTDECHLSREEAVREAEKEIAGMLPDGLHTQNNYLMTIVELGSEENVGFIWTLHEETAGRKQSFVCDFAVWEPKRRKGYASETLRLTEKLAVEAGCLESVLFVSDDSDAARRLYKKCGYRVLRQEAHGKYMIKQLT